MKGESVSQAFQFQELPSPPPDTQSTAAGTAKAWQVVRANTKNQENSTCLFLGEERKALILSSHASTDCGRNLWGMWTHPLWRLLMETTKCVYSKLSSLHSIRTKILQTNVRAYRHVRSTKNEVMQWESTSVQSVVYTDLPLSLKEIAFPPGQLWSIGRRLTF